MSDVGGAPSSTHPLSVAPALPVQDASGAEVGYLAGSFDLLNVAHLDVVDQAWRRCDRLVVGVFSDARVAELTGRAPVVPLDERMALVRHVRHVSSVVVHGSEQQLALAPDLMFTIFGEDAEGPAGAEPLEARRRTASAGLLAALLPLTSDAVAG